MYYSNQFIKNTIILNEKIKKNDSFHIAYCFDDNYAMPAGLSLMSVIKNNRQMNITFHLFVNDLSKKNISNFETLAKELDCEIFCYLVDGNFSINTKTLVLDLTIATCLRFIVPEIVGQLSESVLYLDCDTLCVGSLNDLINLNMDTYLAAVVPDNDKMQNTQGKLYKIEYGKYFNAGVIYFNTVLWNQKKLTEKTFELINNGDIYTFADQDVLNLILKDKTLLLPYDYNRFIALSVNGNEDAYLEENTKIIHYVSKNKPWFEPYQTDLFKEYLSHSPWKNIPLALYNNKKTSSIRAYSRLMFKQKKYLAGIKHYLIYLKTKLKK